MATLKEIKDTIVDLHDGIVAGFSAIQTKIDELKAEIAAGGTITETQLDEVKAQLDAAKADIISQEGSIG